MNEREIAGVRRSIAWLHNRAAEMNDTHAVIILNSAAFSLGVALKGWKEGRSVPPTPTQEGDVREHPLVARLRRHPGGYVRDIILEAADEIERLHARATTLPVAEAAPFLTGMNAVDAVAEAAGSETVTTTRTKEELEVALGVTIPEKCRYCNGWGDGCDHCKGTGKTTPAPEADAEIVEVAAKALWDYDVIDPEHPWDAARVPDKSYFTGASSAVLAAVTPLIRAKALEEAMQLCDREADRARETESIHIELGALRCRDGIRALKGPRP